ncbi:MAG TPA: hypothetical protein PKL73_13510 [Polyangiaceae bacterium]|jgi:hypothetical protein|nr:MAG: hypothetical protein BWY17_04677 [Deltaproteobacteria bacterium ADurb.Bin207]HNS97962.1 hypothetical protein [Polyangiaceae bacterium]HNZ25153.1 hypothetical protein [Polyangiaceae bacterium]HOD24128.1 hypothetical protein [Polyangiaceae bacterium]HOE51250.1 hypothetical protein [Polyangiaceae bacterium]
MKKKLAIAAVAVVAVLGTLLIPVGGKAHSIPDNKDKSMDLSSYPADKPSTPWRLLFIHHSVGGQLLADPGADQELAPSIHATHPNGGGLRKALEGQGYIVREASYESQVGDKTDLFDWLPKFRHDMDKVLRVSFNDQTTAENEKNRIVLFKSCYPNSRFEGLGQPPGNPDGPALTVWNAKASFNALLDEFRKHPDTLFVYFTAPPNAPVYGAEPLFKVLLRKVMRKPTTDEAMASQASFARSFNNWVKSPEGWLKDYPLHNVVVFDYFDLLTNEGASNFLQYPTGNGDDSHPSRAGQQKAAAAFIPFLNRAVHRAALTP